MDTIRSAQQQPLELPTSHIESVTDLIMAHHLVAALDAELTDAKEQYNTAYLRATEDGWTAEELAKRGLN